VRHPERSRGIPVCYLQGALGGILRLRFAPRRLTTRWRTAWCFHNQFGVKFVALLRNEKILRFAGNTVGKNGDERGAGNKAPSLERAKAGIRPTAQRID